MATLTLQARGNPVAELQTASKDLERAAHFAGRSASRRLTRIGRQELVDAAGIRRSSAVRRVHNYGNKTWFGTVPVVATAPYLRTTRARHGRRGLIVDGEAVELGFQRTEGRYRGVPFQRGNDGRLTVIRRDIAEEAETAFQATSAQTDEVVDDEMRKAVGRTLARGAG